MAAPLFAGPVKFLGSFTGELPAPTLPEVAFAGRSNVGKSSALNALLGSGVARVSSTPGRTRALNLFEVGGRWIAVDLPGYGYAKVGRGERNDWRRWIEHYLGQRPTLRLVVALVDARLPAQENDKLLIAALAELGLPTLGLATKVDALPRARREATVTALARALGLPPETVVPFSSTDRIGLEEARAAIVAGIRG